MSKNHYIIPIFVPHEGCPHDCAFCNQHSITGRETQIDQKKVIEEIESYLESIRKYKNDDAVVEISFFGGTFTGIDMKKQNLYLSIAKRFKDNGDVRFIRLSTRPDYIDEGILGNLKKYSVDIIELGSQSFHEDVLKAANRGHSADDIRKASRLIKEYGFTLGIQLMLGLPKADFDRDFYSAEETLKLKPDFVRLYPSLVIKNTAMAEMFKRGEYNPYSLEECVHITKKIFAFFEVNDITVIRIGLQPTKEISSGSELLGGPFHPSIREHVEGSLINDMIKESIIDLKDDVIIKLNSKDVSKLYANKKNYFNEVKNRFKGVIKVHTDDEIVRGNFKIVYKGESKSLDLRRFLIEYLKNGDNRSDINEKK